IEIGPQDPNYFEIPPGLKPFGIGAAMSQFRNMEQASGTGQANQMPEQVNSETPPPAPEPGGEQMGDAAQDEYPQDAPPTRGESIRKGIRGLFRR
ncbi:MAG: hypothetical protein ACR2PZ_07750, partial [Pseudomonadales bacterium]